MSRLLFILTLGLSLLTGFANGADTLRLHVQKQAGSRFQRIQDALDFAGKRKPSALLITIDTGVYEEKLWLENDHVILRGAQNGKTVIRYAEARDKWRLSHADDWGVATINVKASDVRLENLTVINNYGATDSPEETVPVLDSATGKTIQKNIPRHGHQMALRTMEPATRLAAVNCRFISYGGDTVSPWNVAAGKWYFRDCYMEGGVDLICPRGWSWVERCHIKATYGMAAIWHDGSADSSSLAVFKDCRFSGYDGFYAGRYHRDAQMLVLNAHFDANMKDTPIYQASSGKPLRWGHRIYYHNCRQEGGKTASWFANNIPAHYSPETLTPQQVLGAGWRFNQ